MLSRVEVFRGNAPAEADRLGLGGAVLFEPELPARSRVRAGASLGSFGSLGGWAGASVVGRRSAALWAVRREVATNDYPYHDDGGTRFDLRDDRVLRRVNADFSAWDAWSIGRHRLGSFGADPDLAQRVRPRAGSHRSVRRAGTTRALAREADSGGRVSGHPLRRGAGRRGTNAARSSSPPAGSSAAARSAIRGVSWRSAQPKSTVRVTG